MRMENRRKGRKWKRQLMKSYIMPLLKKRCEYSIFEKKTQNDDKCVENMENEIIRKIGWTRKRPRKNGWKKYRKREEQNIVKNKNRLRSGWWTGAETGAPGTRLASFFVELGDHSDSHESRPLGLLGFWRVFRSFDNSLLLAEVDIERLSPEVFFYDCRGLSRRSRRVRHGGLLSACCHWRDKGSEIVVYWSYQGVLLDTATSFAENNCNDNKENKGGKDKHNICVPSPKKLFARKLKPPKLKY